MDAGNMLKPALARGELHVIGATTIDEYRKDIEKDAALERRFQPILVPEPSGERHHRRSCAACATATRRTTRSASPTRRWSAAAELSDRYITDRFLPDKAIDLIDQAGARVRLRTKTAGHGTAARLERRLERAAAGEGRGGGGRGLRPGRRSCATRSPS